MNFLETCFGRFYIGEEQAPALAIANFVTGNVRLEFESPHPRDAEMRLRIFARALDESTTKIMESARLTGVPAILFDNRLVRNPELPRDLAIGIYTPNGICTTVREPEILTKNQIPEKKRSVKFVTHGVVGYDNHQKIILLLFESTANIPHIVKALTVMQILQEIVAYEVMTQGIEQHEILDLYYGD